MMGYRPSFRYLYCMTSTPRHDHHALTSLSKLVPPVTLIANSVAKRLTFEEVRAMNLSVGPINAPFPFPPPGDNLP